MKTKKKMSSQMKKLMPFTPMGKMAKTAKGKKKGY